MSEDMDREGELCKQLRELQALAAGRVMDNEREVGGLVNVSVTGELYRALKERG